MSPSVGNSCPPIMRSVVVLPQPDGPSSTTYSPWSMCRSTSSTATVPPGKTFVSEIRSSPDPLVVEGAAAAAPSPFTSAMRFAASSAEEVVEPFHLVDVLLEERVPRRVVLRPLEERAAVTRLPLLDVTDVAGDAGEVLRGGLAVVPEVVLVHRERRLALL